MSGIRIKRRLKDGSLEIERVCDNCSKILGRKFIEVTFYYGTHGHYLEFCNKSCLLKAIKENKLHPRKKNWSRFKNMLRGVET